ncbi:APC family permease [Paenarthrobacter sp. YJN-5]|uniref:APC family permease n=1 Tax=Paenarthrobacter sp. YJN-5 TaxID=2735316 RepID=UPI001D0CC007|nr:APC family permease [Paenarthrobacter sp. YJN-5]
MAKRLLELFERRIALQVSSSESQREAVGPQTGRTGGDIANPGLQLGHLTGRQVMGLSIASFVPAVGLAQVPAYLAAYSGRSSWLAMAASVVAFTLIGLFITVFARRFIGTGSLYSYIRHAFGSWSTLVIAAAMIPGYIVAIMSLIVGVGVFFGSFLVSVGVANAAGPGIQLLIYVVATLVAMTIAYRGIDLSVRSSVILTVISLPVMLVITIATAFSGNVDLAGQFSLNDFTLNSFLQGLAIGSAYFIGFEGSAALGAETKNPNRNIPRAIIVIPVGIGLFYLAGTVIQVPTLVSAADKLALGISPNAVLAEAAGVGFLSNVSDLVLAVAIFASLIGFFNYGSRVVVSAASDGLLPSSLVKVNKLHKSPGAAIAFIGVPSLIGPALLLWLTPASPLEINGYIATLLVYFWVIPYFLICIGGAILLNRTKGSRSFIVNVGAALASATVLWLYLNGIINPGPAPLNALPYVMIGTFVVFLIALVVSIRSKEKKRVLAQR